MDTDALNTEPALLSDAPVGRFLMGAALAAALLVVLMLSCIAGISWSGWLYWLGLSLISAGLMFTRLRRRLAAPVGALGLLTFMGVAAVRLISATGSPDYRVRTISDLEGRSIARVFDERDVNGTAMALLGVIGAITPSERGGFSDALSVVYDEMDQEEGSAPSPLFPTMIGIQGRESSDLVAMGQGTRVGVVFLHGASGNVGAYCYLVGKVVKGLGGQTLCPSVSTQANWTSPVGRSVVQKSIAILKQRGVSRIILIGLSAGGVGASLLEGELQTDIDGMILIAGSSKKLACTVPTSLIVGEGDERFPLAYMQQAASSCDSALLHVIPAADHFLIVKQRHESSALLQAELERMIDR